MTASTLARLFVEGIVCRFSSPRVLLTDRGTQFTSDLMREICKLCLTQKVFTSAYNPKCDGLVERFNRTLADMLSKFVGTNQRDWDIRLPYLSHAYRTSVHSATLESPFYLMHLQDPVLPIQAIINYVLSPYFDTADDYKLWVLDTWHQAHELVCAWLIVD